MNQHPIVAKLATAWNSQRAADVLSLYAPDATMLHPMAGSDPLRGREAIAGFEQPMFAAFSKTEWKAIDSFTVIQIFQRPAGSAYAYDSSARTANEGRLRVRGYASEDQARERGNRLFARFVRGLRVEITGPLSTDSLNRLLEQIAPLP